MASSSTDSAGIDLVPSTSRKSRGEAILEDAISYLKWKDVKFAALPLDEQLLVKENISRPDLDLQQKDGGTIRKFNRKWYDIYPWLTGSARLNKMFCIVCSVYGGELSWGSAGIDVVKNFTVRADRHQGSKRHIKNMESFLMLGKARRMREKEREIAEQSKRHANEEIQRREIMSQMIDSIFFLIQRNRNICNNNSNNNNNNVDSEKDREALEELIMKRYLYDTCTFKETFGKMHNQLVKSMESVLLEEIRKEISDAEFCSLQTDEIPFKECTHSVIIRYCHKGLVKESFVGFYQIRNTYDLGQIINKIVGDARKLVSHSYDGSSVMQSVRNGIKRIMPKILHVPNHMHKLNMILLQGLQNLKEIRVFTSQVSIICNFFKVPSRRAQLRKEGVNLVGASDTLWKLHSKSVSTIIKNYAKFDEIINNFVLRSADIGTIHSATVVRKILKCPTFVLYSCLFNKIFVYADHLSSVIQKKINTYVDTCVQEIAQTVKNISNFKTDIIIRHCVDETKTHLKIVEIDPGIVSSFKVTAFQIIDSVVGQIKERYADTKFFKFVEIMDGTRFVNYKNKFPKSTLQEFVDNFPDRFNVLRIENELTMIYGDTLKRFSPYLLYSYLYDNGLSELYRETYKMLRLYLTFPLTPTDSAAPTTTGKTVNTLTKIRNYLNHTDYCSAEFGCSDEKSALLYVEKYSNNSDLGRFKETVIDHLDECMKNTRNHHQ